MFLNYYRVFPQGFSSTSKLYSRFLLPSWLLLNIVVIKEELQLENFMCLVSVFLQFNPTLVTHIDTECDIEILQEIWFLMTGEFLCFPILILSKVIFWRPLDVPMTMNSVLTSFILSWLSFIQVLILPMSLSIICFILLLPGLKEWIMAWSSAYPVRKLSFLSGMISISVLA